MVTAVPDVLARIVAHKQAEVALLPPRRAEWEERAAARRNERRSFREALLGPAPAIICEVKKASPSRGTLCHDFSPRRIAGRYQAGGAAALSVLTDEAFFQGSLGDLEEARAAVNLPVLRKDFIIDELQILEAAAHGADAILLIAAILTTPELRRLREAAARFGLTALVEVHHERELEQAIDSGAEVIGVNNRDLRTFTVTLETSLRLAPRMPSRAVRVSESGIRSAGDVSRLRDAGYHAFLVGEHLMQAADPAEALRCLRAS